MNWFSSLVLFGDGQCEGQGTIMTAFKAFQDDILTCETGLNNGAAHTSFHVADVHTFTPWQFKHGPGN